MFTVMPCRTDRPSQRSSRDRWWVPASIALVATLTASCAGSDDSATAEVGPSAPATTPDTSPAETEPPPKAAPTTAAPTTAAPTTTEATTTTTPTTTTTVPVEPCAAPQGVSDISVEAQGYSYPVRVYVPSSASTTDVLPAVVVFHGGGDSGARQASADGFEELAEAEGFVVAHPSTPDGEEKWWEFLDDDFPERDDVAFASALFDSMDEDWCADATKSYAFGMSIGGAFAGRLACEMPERLAGIGAVAHHAVTPFCDPSMPTPVVQFNGTADQITPFDGMSELDSGNPTWEMLRDLVVPDEFAGGAERGGCASPPETTTIGTDVTEYRFTGCDGDVEMLRYEVAGGGHTWPGDANAPGVIEPFGYNTADISATVEAWNFFQQFSR